MTLTSLSSTTSPDGWLEPITGRLADGNYTALVFTFRDDAVFDEDAANRLDGKPLVVLDFAEYGYSSWNHTHMLGDNSTFERTVPNPDYYKALSAWVSRQNIVCYFKRELTKELRYNNRFLKKFPIYPIELLSSKVPFAEAPTKDQWMSRQGGVFHLYGNSHPWRKQLHAAMQVGYGNMLNRLAAVQYTPRSVGQFHLAEQANYWDRYELRAVLEIQMQFRLSVAFPGYGMKCFRHMESCFGCVPVVHNAELEWSIPWTFENALVFPKFWKDNRLDHLEVVERLMETLNAETLYPCMLRAHETCMRYRPENYMAEFINPKIKALL